VYSIYTRALAQAFEDLYLLLRTHTEREREREREREKRKSGHLAEREGDKRAESNRILLSALIYIYILYIYIYLIYIYIYIYIYLIYIYRVIKGPKATVYFTVLWVCGLQFCLFMEPANLTTRP